MGGRFLSNEDQNFVDLVYEDVRKFQDNPRGQRALLFPAVDPRRRYLIHSTVQDHFPALTTLSVGQGDGRRTAVTFKTTHQPSPPPSVTTPATPLEASVTTPHKSNPVPSRPVDNTSSLPKSNPIPSRSVDSSCSGTSKSIPIVTQVFENSGNYSTQNSHSPAARNSVISNPAARGSAPVKAPSCSSNSQSHPPPQTDRSKAEARKEERRRGLGEQKRNGPQQHIEPKAQQQRQYQHTTHKQSQEQRSTHRHNQEQHSTHSHEQHSSHKQEQHSTSRQQDRLSQGQQRQQNSSQRQQGDKPHRRKDEPREHHQQGSRKTRSRSSSSSQSIPRRQEGKIVGEEDRSEHQTADETQGKKRRNRRNKRQKDRTEVQDQRNSGCDRVQPDRNASNPNQSESGNSVVSASNEEEYCGGTNVVETSARNSEGRTNSEGGRRKRLKSTGESEEEGSNHRRSWRASQNYDSRVWPGRGSNIGEEWTGDYADTTSTDKGHQRMPVTVMPPDNNSNNRRRGKAAAQIYRPPPARSSREEVTMDQPQKHPAHLDTQRNNYHQDDHRNNYLQDLQKNSYHHDSVRHSDSQSNIYHQDLSRSSYQQEPYKNSSQDSQTSSYLPDGQNSGRQRTESESSNIGGESKSGRGRRPDQILYIPRGRRNCNGLQDSSSARATPTPLLEYGDLARPPSPAFSICSVASEFSGRNRYNRSRQGSQASIYDGEFEKVRGKPPLSKGDNGRDNIQGYNKHKGSGRFAPQTLQLIERCLNQDSDSRQSERWETESLNYSSSPKSKLGGTSGRERVLKSPTPARDIHSIHSKENVINPMESGKRSRKRRNRRRHSRSREPSADKYNDGGSGSSNLGGSNNRDQFSNGHGDRGFGSSERIFYNSSYERYDRGYDNYDRYSSINNSRASSRNSSRERMSQHNPNFNWRGGSNVSSPSKGTTIYYHTRNSPGKPPSGRMGSLPNVALDFGDSPRKYSNEERFYTLPIKHHKNVSSHRNLSHMKSEEYSSECSLPDRFSQRSVSEKDERTGDEFGQDMAESVSDSKYGSTDGQPKDQMSNKDSCSSEVLNGVASGVDDISGEEDAQPQQSITDDRMDESIISVQSAGDSLEDLESNLESSGVGSIHSEDWSETSNHRTNGTIVEEDCACDPTTDTASIELANVSSIATEVSREQSDEVLPIENDLSTNQPEKEEQDTGGGEKEEKKGSKKFSFNWADEVDDSWDSLYDDAGECLDPDIKRQLSDSIGKVKLEKPTNDYYNYQPKEPEINEEEYGHVIEIYDFPVSFKTQDLMMVFNEFQNTGFDIKWVDDTHALGIFSTALVAAEALNFDHPFIKTRSLASATKPSKAKAMRITDALLPYKPRPATSAALARRLVSGALGLKVNISREVREAERQKLKDAKARKKLEAKQRLDAWEGTLT